MRHCPMLPADQNSLTGLQPFFSNRPKRSPKNAIIVQPYGIGDLLFSFPLLQALKTVAGVSRLDILVGSRTSQIARLSPHVDGIFVIDKDRWKKMRKWDVLRQKLSLLGNFKKVGYDIFIDFSMQPEYAFWAKFFARVPVRAGFEYKKHNPFLNFSLQLPKEGFAGKSVACFVAELALKLGLDIRDKRTELHVPEEKETSALALLKDSGWKGGQYTVVAPGGGATWGKEAGFKQWPAAFFCEFLRLMEERRETGEIVLLGTSEERKLGEFFGGLSHQALDLCGSTDLTAAAAIIKHARLFIGNDGGLAHLAAALNTPVVAFFGPVDSMVYGPVPSGGPVLNIFKELDCRPCYRGFRYRQDCREKSCLTSLTPREAMEKLENSGFFKKIS